MNWRSMLLAFDRSKSRVEDRTSAGIAPPGSGCVGDGGDIDRGPDRADPRSGGTGDDARCATDSRSAEERRRERYRFGQ